MLGKRPNSGDDNIVGDLKISLGYFGGVMRKERLWSTHKRRAPNMLSRD
jgi:hypothetical protein